MTTTICNEIERLCELILNHKIDTGDFELLRENIRVGFDKLRAIRADRETGTVRKAERAGLKKKLDAIDAEIARMVRIGETQYVVRLEQQKAEIQNQLKEI